MVHLGGCIKPNWPEIDSTVIDGTAATIRRALADPSTRAFYQIKQMLSSGLTLRDNMNAAIVTIPCIHGTEVPFSKGALTGLPIAFTPLSTSLTNGATALQVDATPTINYARTDGYLGLTVNFKPAGGEAMTLALTSNQSFANATETGVSFNGIVTAGGETATNANGSISWNGSTGFTLNSPGQYLVTATISWAVSGAGTRGVYLVSSVGGTRYAANEGPPQGTFFTQQQVSAVLPVSSTLTVIVSGTHQAGGALNANGAGALTDRAGFSNRCWAQATRLLDRSVSGYAANVTGILWGG